MDDTLQPRLGEVLRDARNRLGLTQEEAAREVGLALGVYARIERGHALMSLPKLRKACVALSIPPEALLGLGGSKGVALSQEPPHVHEASDPPELRRIMMLLRSWPQHQLRVFLRVARAFTMAWEDRD